MLTRTRRSTVRFDHPVRLPGLDEELPAGAYAFVVEEEPIDGLSFEAWRRTASWLERGEAGRGRVRELLAVTPHDLDAALDRDRDRGTTEPPAGPA